MAPDKKKREDKAYDFHFKLEEAAPGAASGDALTDLVRSQLRTLLDVIALTKDGKDLEADGFRFLESGSPVHKIFE
jgi:hypothetical protein